MACYDFERFEWLEDCWYAPYLDAVLKAGHVKKLDQKIAECEAHIIKTMFDDAVARKAQGKFPGFNVTWKCPGEDWTGTPFQVLYDITEDDKFAAKAYGNLVCRMACHRPESWGCFKEETHADGSTSRSYVPKDDS